MHFTLGQKFIDKIRRKKNNTTAFISDSKQKETQKPSESLILKYAKLDNNKKQAWLGFYPQFNMDIIDIERCTNFRLAPNFHGKYDTVWIYETPLSQYNILSWKIIVDESIRLLKENGKLIIRTFETKEFSIPMIKSFLFRNINLNVELDFEEKRNDGSYILVLQIHRQNFEIYNDKSWTFAMLTNGKKQETVIKFLESIRNNEKTKSQIIISGPKNESYDKYDVEYIDLSQFRDDKYPEIARKKNAIAQMATGANILIAHDRYYLDKDFFNDFEKYGYDFDFLTLKQISTTDNEEYPSYCYTYGFPLENTHVGIIQDKNVFLENTYINGGLMVFKTKILNYLKFNSMLFWNQKEDVELSEIFIKNSVIPRINFLSKSFTNRSKNDYRWDVFDGRRITKTIFSNNERLFLH